MTLLHSDDAWHKGGIIAYVQRREQGACQSPRRNPAASQRQLPRLRGPDDGSRSVARPRRSLSQQLRLFMPEVGAEAGPPSVVDRRMAGCRRTCRAPKRIVIDPTSSMVGSRNLRLVQPWHRSSGTRCRYRGTFSGPTSAFRSMNVEVSVVEENRRRVSCSHAERGGGGSSFRLLADGRRPRSAKNVSEISRRPDFILGCRRSRCSCRPPR